MDEAVAAGLRFLAAAQNKDGGWGYVPGGATVVEPTAAGLMACALHGGAATARAAAWLAGAQTGDGSWGVTPAVDAGSWMTAWAVWSLAVTGGPGGAMGFGATERGARWLAAVPVLRLTDSASVEDLRRLVGLDAALSGWPWQPGEASWVTPTAIAVLALCAAGEAANARVLEAVEFLRDRACPAGGWNFGNPTMIGKALPPLLPETGLSLLAMRAAGVRPDDAVVKGALDHLGRADPVLTGSLDRAWAAMGLAAWGVSAPWDELVRGDLLQPAGGPVGVLAAAVGLMALADPDRLAPARPARR